MHPDRDDDGYCQGGSRGAATRRQACPLTASLQRVVRAGSGGPGLMSTGRIVPAASW